MDHSLLTHMLKYFNFSGINGPDTLQVSLPNLSLLKQIASYYRNIIFP